MEKLTELEQEIARLMWVSCDTNTLLEDEECVNIVKKEAYKIRKLVKEESEETIDAGKGLYAQLKEKYEPKAIKIDDAFLEELNNVFKAEPINVKIKNPLF